MGRTYTTFIGSIPPTRSTTTGITETVTWTNTSGAPMYITGGWVWGGVDADGVTDFAYRFYNATSGDIYRWNNWDHYKTDGTDSIRGNTDEFSLPGNDYFLVEPNDVIALTITAIAYPQFSPPPNVAAMAIIRWKASVN